MKKFILIFVCSTITFLKSFAQCVPGDHFWCSRQEAQQFRMEKNCYHPEGFAFSISTEGGDGLQTLYRFKNDSMKLHFWSTSKEEGIKGGYTLEGPYGFVAVGKHIANTIPIYRFYNPTTKNHFYCKAKNGELAPQLGYIPEGIAFYAWNPGFASLNVVRLYSPTNEMSGSYEIDKAIWKIIDQYVFVPPYDNRTPTNPAPVPLPPEGYLQIIIETLQRITCKNIYYKNNSGMKIKVKIRYDKSLFDRDCSQNQGQVEERTISPGFKELFFKNVGLSGTPPTILSAVYVR